MLLFQLGIPLQGTHTGDVSKINDSWKQRVNTIQTIIPRFKRFKWHVSQKPVSAHTRLLGERLALESPCGCLMEQAVGSLTEMGFGRFGRWWFDIRVYSYCSCLCIVWKLMVDVSSCSRLWVRLQLIETLRFPSCMYDCISRSEALSVVCAYSLDNTSSQHYHKTRYSSRPSCRININLTQITHVIWSLNTNEPKPKPQNSQQTNQKIRLPFLHLFPFFNVLPAVLPSTLRCPDWLGRRRPESGFRGVESGVAGCGSGAGVRTEASGASGERGERGFWRLLWWGSFFEKKCFGLVSGIGFCSKGCLEMVFWKG